MELPPKVIMYLLHFLFILFENVPTSFMNKRPLHVQAFMIRTEDGDYRRWKDLHHLYDLKEIRTRMEP